MADTGVNHPYSRFVRNAPADPDANTVANTMKTEPGAPPTAPITQASLQSFPPPPQHQMPFNYAPYMRNTVPTMMLPNGMRVPPPPPPPPPLMNFATGRPPSSSQMPTIPEQSGQMLPWGNTPGPHNYPRPQPPPPFHPTAQPMQNPEFLIKSLIERSLNEQEKEHKQEIEIWTRKNQEKDEKLEEAQRLIQQKETEKQNEVNRIQEEKSVMQSQMGALVNKLEELAKSKDVSRHIEQLDIKSKKIMELESEVSILQQLKNKEIGQWKVKVDQLNLKLKEAQNALLLEQQKPEKRQITVDELRDQIESIQRELKQSKEQVETLTEQLSSRTKEFGEMSSTVDHLEITIQTQASEISSLQEDLKKELEESEIILNERIAIETELRLLKEQVKALQDEKTVEQTNRRTEIEQLGITVQRRVSDVARLFENLTKEQQKSAMIQKEKSDVESKLKLFEEQLSELEATKNTLRDEKTKWKTEKDRLMGDNLLLVGNVKSLKTALEAVTPSANQKKIEEFESKINKLQQSLADANVKFKKAQGSLVEANAKIDKQSRRLERRSTKHDVDLKELQNQHTDAIAKKNSKIEALKARLEGPPKENKSIGVQYEKTTGIRHGGSPLHPKITEEQKEWIANRQTVEQTVSQLVSRINELVAVTLTMKKELKEYKAADKELKEKNKEPIANEDLTDESHLSDPSILVPDESEQKELESSLDKESIVEKPVVPEKHVTDPLKLIGIENKEKQTESSKSSSDKELTVKKEPITEQPISVPPRKRGRPRINTDQGPEPKKSKTIN